MIKVLVTGGAGFIGFHLARSLANQKYQVTICDNLFRGRMDDELKKLCAHENVTFIHCDLTDKEQFKQLGKEYDYVYHLAAINGTRYFYEMPYEVLRVNILSVINLLEFFKDTKCKILFASSSEAHAGTFLAFGVPVPTPEDVPLTISDVYNPRFSYAGSKIAGELLLINYARLNNSPISIVRYCNTYGPRMGFEHVVPEFCMRLINKEDPFNIYGGEQTRSFCYISDAVEATKLVMESASCNNQIVNIGNPFEEITVRQLAERMFDLFDFYPTFTLLPRPKGDVDRRCPNIDKLLELTNFKPKVSLIEGLKETVQWYRQVSLDIY